MTSISDNHSSIGSLFALEAPNYNDNNDGFNNYTDDSESESSDVPICPVCSNEDIADLTINGNNDCCSSYCVETVPCNTCCMHPQFDPNCVVCQKLSCNNCPYFPHTHDYGNNQCQQPVSVPPAAPFNTPVICMPERKVECVTRPCQPASNVQMFFPQKENQDICTSELLYKAEMDRIKLEKYINSLKNSRGLGYSQNDYENYDEYGYEYYEGDGYGPNSSPRHHGRGHGPVRFNDRGRRGYGRGDGLQRGMGRSSVNSNLQPAPSINSENLNAQMGNTNDALFCKYVLDTVFYLAIIGLVFVYVGTGMFTFAVIDLTVNSEDICIVSIYSRTGWYILYAVHILVIVLATIFTLLIIGGNGGGGCCSCRRQPKWGRFCSITMCFLIIIAIYIWILNTVVIFYISIDFLIRDKDPVSFCVIINLSYNITQVSHRPVQVPIEFVYRYAIASIGSLFVIFGLLLLLMCSSMNRMRFSLTIKNSKPIICPVCHHGFPISK